MYHSLSSRFRRWTCCRVICLMGMDLLWSWKGLIKVWLGVALPPLRCGLGLFTLCFLLYSFIFFLEASGCPPQTSNGIKIVGDHWMQEDKRRICKLNMGGVHLDYDHWYGHHLQSHVQKHHFDHLGVR